MICVNKNCDNGKVSCTETRASRSEAITIRKYSCNLCGFIFFTKEIFDRHSPRSSGLKKIREEIAIKTRITRLDKMKKEPCKSLRELAAKAQAIIDARNGVQSDELHKELGINHNYFKAVLPHIKTVRGARVGYQHTYYPEGTIIEPLIKQSKPKSTEVSEKLIATNQKIQELIDQNKGITSLQIRIALGLDMFYFKRAAYDLKSYKVKSNGFTTYYPVGYVEDKLPEYVRPIFKEGEINRTIWATASPWSTA
jgi:hypothetical protein